MHAFGFAFFKTLHSEKASVEHPNGKWVNIEAHSIAFSALFLWLIPAVFLSSVIGVSQTELEIPRKLNTFRKQLKGMDLPIRIQNIPGEIPLEESNLDSTEDENEDIMDPSKNVASADTENSEHENFGGTGTDIPLQNLAAATAENMNTGEDCSDGNCSEDDMLQPDDGSLEQACLDSAARIRSGGLYSWQPGLTKAIKNEHRPAISLGVRFTIQLLSVFLVATCVAISMWISANVPPEGWNCRHGGELSAFVVWVISWLVDFLISMTVGNRLQYRYMVAKDSIFGTLIIVIILITQWGVFHRCDCYTDGSTGKIVNPLDASISKILDMNFAHQWLTITMTGISFQLVASMCLGCWYILGFRVYLQRDDGRSNFDVIPGTVLILKRFFGRLENFRF
jgi:hypothetical protein